MGVAKTPQKLNVMMVIMYFLLSSGVIFYAAFFRLSLMRIVIHHNARSFLNDISNVPVNLTFSLVMVCIGSALLGISWILRQISEESRTHIFLLIVDFFLCLYITSLLDYNYNGIFLWAFANILMYTKHYGHWYLMTGFGVMIYLVTGTSAGIMRHKVWRLEDFTATYPVELQGTITALFGLINAASIILFFIFCIMLIAYKQETIDNINELYSKLSTANTKLKDANARYEELMAENARMAKVVERNRIAREVHDTIGHTLTGLAAGLDACVALSANAPEALRKQLELLAEICRQGLLDVRKSVSQLRPDTMERQSLLSAIRELIAKTREVTGVEIRFGCTIISLHLEEDEENAIYRIVQEGITNAIRHGKATKISIEMQLTDEGIHILINDNGEGCKNIEEGFGLRHMRERVQMLQGKIEFRSNDGFEIETDIPLRIGEGL
ncbi:Signal transduction histidine kinase [Lachnospiraceae bacterium KH1T2]|nr:Signal transduction histidine kinase [Lachnospiraceae bacterium KH1T2]